METNRAIAKAFLDAWCSREFDGLDARLDGNVIEALRGALPVVPIEVLRADVLTVEEGLRFCFRFRVPSGIAGGHMVEERVLVRTDGEIVPAVELFGERLEARSRELMATGA